MIRQCIFWSHLVIGIVVGIIVFIMSATGALLTYEKQIHEWDESRHSVIVIDETPTLTTDDVLNIVRAKHPDEHHFYIRWVNEKGRAIPVWAGSQRYLISPYSGEILQVGQSKVTTFLHVITDLHRWLAFEGKQQPIAKTVTAYSNLFFLFLIITGAYLWLPRRFRWPLIKSNIVFKRQAKNQQAKYFNWHHVFGFWATLPLIVIVCTATIFHFHWSADALYLAFGEQAPESRKRATPVDLVDGEKSYHTLFQVAKQHAANHGAEDWYSMWLEFGREAGNTRFYIDRTIGNDPSSAYALHLNNNTAEVDRVKRHTDWSKGDQAWDVARYLHTGEYFGVFGQTIAGLASLAACFLVYTGFLLSWRRFIPKKRIKRLATTHSKRA